MPQPEPWPRIYREAPEIFQAFGRAEDPEGIIAQRLLDLAGLAGRRVLEIGCGTGRYSRAWAKAAAEYVALEPNPGLLALAGQAGQEEAVPLLRARGESLPFRTRSVERVLATWVLAYLKPKACDKVVEEALRVLSPGGGIWLVENHWTGAFQVLRQREGYGGEPGVVRLIEEHGFKVAEVIETELRFTSEAETQHILGSLCGPEVAERLEQHPRTRLGHHVMILHRPA